MTKGAYDAEDCGVAADDEGKLSEGVDSVSDSHWQLVVQIFGTFL